MANLTPGVLDGSALHAFKYGACGGLAIVLHRETGWPIYAVTDAHNVHDGRAGGGSALHWVVQHPSGQFLDVDGLHTGEALIEEYEAEADDSMAAIGLSNEADAAEWYVECQGEPVSLSVIRSFVEPVLALASPSPQGHGDVSPTL